MINLIQGQSSSERNTATHPGVKEGSPASVGSGKFPSKSARMQLDMSALAILEPRDDPNGALSPEKCPSPLQLTPKHSAAQQPIASLYDCTFDQCSNSSNSTHQRPGYALTSPHMVHPLPFQSNHQCSSPACGIQQQLQEHPYLSVPSGSYPSLAANIQSELSCSIQCDSDPSISRDDILMDFWALLQQTQQNLQDMLVDLETARIELDLSNGRATEAENNANALKIQLAAAQQKNNALEGQLQHLQSRDSDASSRASALTQRNTELSIELRQAQRAAATLELKLERMQLQLAAAQKEKAAAAQAAAAASSGADPAAAAAQEAATAAAQALVSQLRAELSQTRSELATSHSRAARAELELAVARTKVLVAQQEASASADRCSSVEAENTTLRQQLGAAAATAEVAAADKQKLEQQIELLTLKIEQKESRLRNSMSNLARASTSLRASFNAQGGMFDVEMLRSNSTHLVADIVRKSADIKSMLRASQQQLQQQQHQNCSIAEGDSSGSVSGSGTPRGMLTPQACPSIPERLDRSASGGRGSDTSDTKSVTDSRNINSQDGGADCAAVAGRQDLLVESAVRTSSPFAAAAVQDGRNADRSSSSTTDAIIQPLSNTAAVTEDAREADAAGAYFSSRQQSTSRTNSSQGINHSVSVDRQSPIFKRRPSAGGRSSGGGNSSQSILSARPGSTAGSAAVTPRTQQGKSTAANAGLPPRPRRTSPSGVSAGGRSPTASPRNTLGLSLSPAGSSTPNLKSPDASRCSSSSGGSSASAAVAQLPDGVQYEPDSSSTSKAQGRRCGSSSSTGLAAAAAGCGSTDCMVCSHRLSIAAGAAVMNNEAREVPTETATAERESAIAGTEAAAVCAEPKCCQCAATTTAAETKDDASRSVSASTAQRPVAGSAAETAAGSNAVTGAAATACVEALDCTTSPHKVPSLHIPSSSSSAAAAAATAVRVAKPLSPLTSPPRSPVASRHVCKITQFAAVAPSSAAAENSSSGSIGPVSEAMAIWENHAAAAAAGSKDHAPVAVEPEEIAEGEANVTLAGNHQDKQSAVALSMPELAGLDACASEAGLSAASSALSEAAAEDDGASEAATEEGAADSAGTPDTQPALGPDIASAECLPAAEPDDRPSGQVDQDSNASNSSDDRSDAIMDIEAFSSSRQHRAAPEEGLADDNISSGPEASAATTATTSIAATGCAGPRLAKPQRSRIPRHSVQRWLAAAVLPASSVIVGALFLSVGLTHPTRELTAQQTEPQSASSQQQ